MGVVTYTRKYVLNYSMYIFVLWYAGLIGLFQFMFDGQREQPIRGTEVDVTNKVLLFDDKSSTETQ